MNYDLYPYCPLARQRTLIKTPSQFPPIVLGRLYTVPVVCGGVWCGVWWAECLFNFSASACKLQRPKDPQARCSRVRIACGPCGDFWAKPFLLYRTSTIEISDLVPGVRRGGRRVNSKATLVQQQSSGWRASGWTSGWTSRKRPTVEW